ncbi:g3578 [Coccomyxa elongata]
MALSMTTLRANTFLTGSSVRRPVARAQARRINNRLATPVQAKYGSDSEYFDLDDLEDTTGSWELYGQEDEKRYPSLQAEFFNRAAAPLTRRESLLAFTFVGGAASILLWGAKGSKDVALPIQQGPKKGGEKGPRGKI